MEYLQKALTEGRGCTLGVGGTYGLRSQTEQTRKERRYGFSLCFLTIDNVASCLILSPS